MPLVGKLAIGSEATLFIFSYAAIADQGKNTQKCIHSVRFLVVEMFSTVGLPEQAKKYNNKNPLQPFLSFRSTLPEFKVCLVIRFRSAYLQPNASNVITDQ